LQNHYGDLKADDAKRLKGLERENTRLNAQASPTRPSTSTCCEELSRGNTDPGPPLSSRHRGRGAVRGLRAPERVRSSASPGPRSGSTRQSRQTARTPCALRSFLAGLLGATSPLGLAPGEDRRARRGGVQEHHTRPSSLAPRGPSRPPQEAHEATPEPGVVWCPIRPNPLQGPASTSTRPAMGGCSSS
jgi:hypothetical protein